MPQYGHSEFPPMYIVRNPGNEEIILVLPANWQHQLEIPTGNTNWKYQLEIPTGNTNWQYQLVISTGNINWQHQNLAVKPTLVFITAQSRLDKKNLQANTYKIQQKYPPARLSRPICQLATAPLSSSVLPPPVSSSSSPPLPSLLLSAPLCSSLLTSSHLSRPDSSNLR
jgi:hypothetical protein